MKTLQTVTRPQTAINKGKAFFIKIGSKPMFDAMQPFSTEKALEIGLAAGVPMRLQNQPYETVPKFGLGPEFC